MFRQLIRRTIATPGLSQLTHVPKVSASRHQFQQLRYLSNEDLKKTLNDLKEKLEKEKEEQKPSDDGENKSEQSASSNNQGAPAFDKVKTGFSFFLENVKLAYKEMTGEDQESKLSHKFQQAESFRAPKQNGEQSEEQEDEEPKERGPSAIVVVKDGKSAWEQMKDRLQDSPFIRELLKHSRKVTKAASETPIGKTATGVSNSFKDRIEDFREFWETSQNPIVYTLSGVWDNLTGETEEAIAIAEIRKLDPRFIKEEWAEEVRIKLAPEIIKAHLEGNTKALKPWLGEAVYNKLAADIRIRKEEGIVFNSNILHVDENAVVMKYAPEMGGPVIVVMFMVQQINCIKNRKGEIIEGAEHDIKAKFYSIAFQIGYDEVEHLVKWKIVDYEFGGDIPYY